MFSSSAATPGSRSSRAAISTYSSGVRPAMLTMIGAARVAQVRQMMGDERLDPVVVQADRIQQAARRLDRPPRLVPRPRLLGDGLRQDPAQAVQVHQTLHLPRIAEGPGSHQDRVGQIATDRVGRPARCSQGRAMFRTRTRWNRHQEARDSGELTRSPYCSRKPAGGN